MNGSNSVESARQAAAIQTFLPHPGWEQSARSLDMLRLGKQRSESLIIFRTLLLPREEYTGWRHHPAVLMWKGFEVALFDYTRVICSVWTERGGRNDTVAESMQLVAGAYESQVAASEPTPWWLGRSDLHVSHQSNLLRKDPGHYRPQFPGVPDDLPYHWPVRAAAYSPKTKG